MLRHALGAKRLSRPAEVPFITDPVLGWEIPLTNVDTSSLLDLTYHYIYRGTTDVFASATQVGQVLGSETIWQEFDAPLDTLLYYWITAVDSEGTESDPLQMIARKYTSL